MSYFIARNVTLAVLRSRGLKKRKKDLVKKKVGTILAPQLWSSGYVELVLKQQVILATPPSKTSKDVGCCFMLARHSS